MQRVVFDMSFAVDVPEGTADRLARLMERFINEVCRIIPTPKMSVGVGEISPERNDDETS